MKRITGNSSIVRWSGVLGVATLFVGTISLMPANADDYTRDNRAHNEIHRDITDIRRDEEHLHDLYHRRDWLADHRDWRAVHRLDDEISRLKRHIDHDREELRQEARRSHRDQDSQYNQGRNGYSRDRYGSNTGYNGGYRNGQSDYRGRDNGPGDYRVH